MRALLFFFYAFLFAFAVENMTSKFNVSGIVDIYELLDLLIGVLLKCNDIIRYEII